MTTDPWANLKQFTDARIGLGRSGAAMPTREVLNFALSHAMARDAVTTPIEWGPIEQGLQGLGLDTVSIKSADASIDPNICAGPISAGSCRPRRVRLLRAIEANAAKPDLVVLVGDGLSSLGVAANVVPMMRAFLQHVAPSGLEARSGLARRRCARCARR